MDLPAAVLYDSLKLLFMDNDNILGLLSEDMFSLPNKAAFEALMYPLLKMIDNSKCVNLPPPNRVTEIKFRSEVARIVKELTAEHPAVQIPPLTKSHFLSPGGDKFIDLMNKLVSLALEIKVKRILDGRTDVTLLPRPHHVKKQNVADNAKVLLSMSTHYKKKFEEIKLHRQKLVEGFKDADLQIRASQQKLKQKMAETKQMLEKAIEGLECDPEKKRRLLEIDEGVIEEWKEDLKRQEAEVERKEKIVEYHSEKLNELSNLITSLSSKCDNSNFLDGTDILPNSSDGGGGDDYTRSLYEDGKLMLSKFFESANMFLEILGTELQEAKIVDISSLLPQLDGIRQEQTKMQEILTSSHEKMSLLESFLAAAKKAEASSGTSSGEASESVSKATATPSTNGFQNTGIGNLEGDGLFGIFKSTPPFDLLDKMAAPSPVLFGGDIFSFTPVSSQGQIDVTVQSTIKVNPEDLAGLLCPTVQKKSVKHFLSSRKKKVADRAPHARKGLEIRRNLLASLAQKSATPPEASPEREERSIEVKNISSPLLEMSSSLEKVSPASLRIQSPMTLDKVVERMILTIPTSVMNNSDPSSHCTDFSVDYPDMSLEEFEKLNLTSPVPARSLEEHFSILRNSSSCVNLSMESPPVFSLFSSDDDDDDDDDD